MRRAAQVPRDAPRPARETHRPDRPPESKPLSSQVPVPTMERKRMPTTKLTSHDVGPSKGPLSRWLENLGLHRPELRAWAMYDWANSAMVTTIITAVFPIYYANVACNGRLRRRRGHATVRDGNGDRHGDHRLAVSRAGNHCRLEGRQEEDARRLPGPGGHCRSPGCSSFTRETGSSASVLVHPGEHRRQRQLCLLRRPAAACRPRRRDRPGFDGRLCSRLHRRRHAAGAQPGLDHEAGVVRPARGGGFLAAGHASHAAGIPVGRRLVAGLFDPAVSPRARAAGRGRRRVQPVCRSGLHSHACGRPPEACA